jgi:mannosyl-3-phosphoglycerate phosphatase
MASLTSAWWPRPFGFTSRLADEHPGSRIEPPDEPDRIVLFSDPDTLRNGCGSSSAAMRSAIATFEEHNVAVVLWGNETRSEMELIQSDLNLHHPFISENGGGLFIPHSYFLNLPDDVEAAPNYDVIHLGRPYYEVAEALHATGHKLGIDIIGFSDMSIQDVAHTCDLSLAQARLAKLREYDEPFRVLSSEPSAYSRVCQALKRLGFRCFLHESFHHASSVPDKAQSLTLLTSLYRADAGRVLTIGLAQEASEVCLLRAVDIPLVLYSDKADSTRLGRKVPTARFVDAGAWCQAVLQLVHGNVGGSSGISSSAESRTNGR